MNKIIKIRVSRRTLLFTAGSVWIFAGVNVLCVGLNAWDEVNQSFTIKLLLSFLVLIVFYFGVFRKLYFKHTKRISKKGDENCPFSFFDRRGWIIMAFMISFGITARAYHFLPSEFISVFYCGLSLAMLITGGQFVVFWHKWE